MAMTQSNQSLRLCLNKVPTLQAQYLPPNEIKRLKRKRRFSAFRGIPNKKKSRYNTRQELATALNLKESLIKGFPFYVEVNAKGNLLSRRRYLLFEQELCRSRSLSRYLKLVRMLLNTSYENFLKKAVSKADEVEFFIDKSSEL